MSNFVFHFLESYLCPEIGTHKRSSNDCLRPAGELNCPSRAFAPSNDVSSIAYQLLQQGNFRLRLEVQHSFLPALSHVWRWRVKTTILLLSVRSVETEQHSRPFNWRRWSVFFRRRTILMFTRGSSWHCVAT